MAKRMLAMGLALCLALLFAGCETFGFQNINDLLRAPALGRGMDEIQNALIEHLGMRPQFKYPKMGDWRSPLRQADLNGDGTEEAVLLYSIPESTGAGGERSNNVYVAILEQQDGAWVVVQDVQGLSTEVASLEVANLLEDGTQQLLVGFANNTLSVKTLALYTYEDHALQLMYRTDYSLYRIDDFTGRGGNDLVVMSRNEQQNRVQMQYVPVADGQFLTGELPAPVVLESNMASCEAIVPSDDGNGGRLLVVDGMHAQIEQLVSQFIYYTGERFYTEDPNPLRGATGRLSTLLKSRDIDGDGRVEVPTRLRSINTVAGDKSLEYIQWLDFIGQPVEEPIVKEFGIFDPDRSVYIRLPAQWQNTVDVVDGTAKGEWAVESRRTRQKLLELVVLEQGQAPQMTSTRVPGTSSTYLVFSAALPQAELEEITMTALN